MPKRNLQRAAEDARIAGLLMHGIELCRAVKRIGIKADGFSMHTKDGLHEFVTDTHTLKDARRKLLDLPLGGFPGLAAADEAKLCDRCLAFLKAAVCGLRNKKGAFRRRQRCGCTRTASTSPRSLTSVQTAQTFCKLGRG